MKRGPVIVIGVLALVAGLLVVWTGKRRNQEIKRIDRGRHREDLLDEALMESFPASDPVSVSVN